MTLTFAPLQLPLAAGLRGKTDPRAKQPPALDIARDIHFDEVGGVQTRPPFVGMPTAILGGGTIAGPRKLVGVGDELLLFTQDSLYSWSDGAQKWVFKAEHLAVKVTEETKFARSADQVDTDRAELSNVIVYTWTGTDIANSLVYVAATDRATGAVILAPTIVDPGLAGSSPRLVALGTKILLVWIRNIASAIYGLIIDPANVAGSITTPTLIQAQGLVKPYDIVKNPIADSAYLVTALNPATSYTIVKITSALGLTAATKARTCDGPIAVSLDPTASFAQIVRANGANIQGDLLNVTTNADVFTAQAVGTATGTTNHIAVAHRSVQNGGFYRAYAFWSASESAGAGVNWTSKWNWVDTNSSLGTQANFVRLLAMASRAFDYNGQVYVWGVFAGATSSSAAGFVQQLQNTYFLYRDDATLVTKASFGSAGGLPPTFRLPGVSRSPNSSQLYTFCGTVRRQVPIGANSASLGYAERAPRDISVAFDNDEARRCVRLGATLYITGGEVLQYDGTGLYEVGFHVYPWAIGVAQAAAGSIANGIYAFKATWKWPNARGDIDRSTTATVITGTIAAGPTGFDVTINPLYTTRKIAQPPGCEVWRTTISPVAESPFYLASSGDPSVLTGNNKYIANDPTVFPLPTFHDALADASLAILQSNPENGLVLESLAPPGASIVLASDNRLFLAGIAGDPHRVWYSKQRGAFEVAAFNDTLAIDVPIYGGDITALAFLNETLIVFREHAIYAFAGDGFDNLGQGQNYGPARILSLDVGAVSHEAVALAPMGLVFKSSKGWMLLNRGWAVDDISDAASDFDADTVKAIHVVESTSQVRILTDQRLLLWDYRPHVNQWSEWTLGDGYSATLWNGNYLYSSSTSMLAEQTVFSGLTYGMDVETAWVKLNDVQGYGRVLQIMALGEFRSAFLLRIRVAYDYAADGLGGWNYVDDIPWEVAPTAPVGGPLQVKHGPMRQQCQAIKVRLTAVVEGLRALCTISTSTDVIHCLTGGNWAAVLAAQEPYFGERGNVLAFSCAFDVIAAGTFSIDVRDHLAWDQPSQRWVEQRDGVGIRVQSRVGSAPTAAQLEAAINTGSSLCFVAVADPTPAKVLDAAVMNGTTAQGTFGGGTYQTPTGEAMKLTGLALLVGSKPNKLNQRLPAAQKT